MPTEIPKSARAKSRKMRKNLTDGEARLWSELKQFKRLYGIHVRRQVPVGPYFADFAVLAKKLIIELDGEHHFTPEGMKHDATRTAYLERQGFHLHRMTTGEWADTPDACIESLLRELGVHWAHEKSADKAVIPAEFR